MSNPAPGANSVTTATAATTVKAGSTFTVALLGVALRACGQWAKVLKNRRQVAQLHHLDDRALKDIGLVRSDVQEALSASILRDPSQHLVDVAGEFRGGSKVSADTTGQAANRHLNRLRRPDAVVSVGAPTGCLNA